MESRASGVQYFPYTGALDLTVLFKRVSNLLRAVICTVKKAVHLRRHVLRCVTVDYLHCGLPLKTLRSI